MKKFYNLGARLPRKISIIVNMNNRTDTTRLGQKKTYTKARGSLAAIIADIRLH